MQAVRVRRTDWSGRVELRLLASLRLLCFRLNWTRRESKFEATLISDTLKRGGKNIPVREVVNWNICHECRAELTYYRHDGEKPLRTSKRALAPLIRAIRRARVGVTELLLRSTFKNQIEYTRLKNLSINVSFFNDDRILSSIHRIVPLGIALKMNLRD